MLKHSDCKEFTQFYARLQLAKKDEDRMKRVLDVLSTALAELSDGGKTQAAFELDMEDNVGMSRDFVEVLQAVLAKDNLQYEKNLEVYRRYFVALLIKSVSSLIFVLQLAQGISSLPQNFELSLLAPTLHLEVLLLPLYARDPFFCAMDLKLVRPSP
ncbi:hypothetical protein IWX90DRAFT_486112 [Phyllosticta citrichinensis]|uniref:Uncharacterized protein n=1 Tax=Phyllosticta citrichinensis TaxID=1130410 RepID=A0ABR1XXY2_9PEZI